MTEGIAMNSLADWLWWLLAVFFMVIYFMMLFRIIIDIFRNHDSSGWAKAGWLILLLFIPLITMLIYVIANGKGMAQRDAAQYQAMKQSQDDYIRSVAAPADPSAQISQAHALLEKGAITQQEFDALKAKALA
ncbi:SHOCT domain-containing protein [Nocardioides sp.]|uniref:SHOCT domain-containing protein n=1 Tax=Nocardioides sp. TaxID=35761 RepID=UPI002D1FB99D|nr:SHOCT domain-containing protein [Nocardioides sp.]